MALLTPPPASMRVYLLYFIFSMEAVVPRGENVQNPLRRDLCTGLGLVTLIRDNCSPFSHEPLAAFPFETVLVKRESAASFLSFIASWPSRGTKPQCSLQRYAPDLDGTIIGHHHSAAPYTINVVTTAFFITRDGRLLALPDGVVRSFRR